jgi:aminotransferase in exopolysaccharide biosynthesis
MDRIKRNRLVEFIRELYKKKEGLIPLHEPRFNSNEIKYVEDCIQSTFVSSVGKYVNKFEHDIEKITGAKKAIATVNGTSALHTALILSGVLINDEVLTQPLTFVATANAIRYIGAIPVFIDIDKNTLGLSPDSLLKFFEKETIQTSKGLFNKVTKRKISACIPVHTFGHPAKIDEIVSICENYNVPVIEDAAESLGSFFKGRHTGTFGKLGILSFNGNKIVTSGGGGMILTNDDKLANEAKHITTTAKINHQWEYDHDRVGYNYRMPNINAALGLAQLENLNTYVENKRRTAKAYIDFCNSEDLRIFQEPIEASSNYWLNALILNDEQEKTDFIEYCHSKNVLVRPAWKLLNHLSLKCPFYKTSLENAEWFEKRLVNLPSSVIF